MENAPADAIRSTAAFSPCGQYRWWLRRQWDGLNPLLLFVGLNPSRADARRDDPTLRRLMGFAQRWGFGALEVVNLFARISPSPALLKRAAEPVGDGNDLWIQRALLGIEGQSPRAVWVGWGNQGAWRSRDRAVLQLLQQQGLGRSAAASAELLCLGLTAAGQPRHPLYAPAGLLPQHLVLAQSDASGASCGSSLLLQR